jgi:DNA-binding CsgD family transcriptional regulator
MQTKKILAFSDFLARPPKSYNEIAQFLAMNTFSEEEFSCIYIGELVETGFVCPIAGFGFDSKTYDNFPDIPIHGKYPLTETIRSNTTNIFHNNQPYKTKYPLMQNLQFPDDWKSGITIPVYPIGGMALCSSQDLELTESMNVFYIAIGSLLGLYASRLPKTLIEEAIILKTKIDLPQVPLTDRQIVISGMLERGFNNAHIAREIGYSESLVRQETVAIYRKLEVSGRKAMQINADVANATLNAAS